MKKAMKVLIGYDGAAPSAKALAELEMAGLPRGARVIVLKAVEPWAQYAETLDGRRGGWPSRPAREQYRRFLQDLVDKAASASEEAARRLAERHPAWKVRGEACLEGAAVAILEKAARWKPDLIVVGDRGESALGRLLVGGVCSKVLHGARRGVRVSRARLRRKDRPIRLVIGYDGSPGADAAVDEVASRAWPPGTKVRLMGAVPRPGGAGIWGLGAGMYPVQQAGFGRDAAKSRIEAAARRLSVRGLVCETALVTGDPREMLLKAAGKGGVDCIFLGSRGLKGNRRILLGSVSAAVALHAECTVEIVRP